MVSVQEWIKERQAEKKTTLTNSGGGVTPVTVTKVAYIYNPPNYGWVQFLRDDKPQTESFSICTSTKLMLTGLNDAGNRVRFKIENGEYMGRSGSMIIKRGADEHLTDTPLIDGLAQIKVKYGKREDWYSKHKRGVLDQQFATLTVEGVSVTVTLNSLWDGQHKPLDVGTYEIEFPDHIHKREDTEGYDVNGTPVQSHGIWFPIRTAKIENRYLHIGNVSHGCVTVIDLEKYTQIHDIIIKYKGRMSQNGKKQVIAIMDVTK